MQFGPRPIGTPSDCGPADNTHNDLNLSGDEHALPPCRAVIDVAVCARFGKPRFAGAGFVLPAPTICWAPARRRVVLPESTCCRSSVVEHSLGKGEVDSSILSGSTIQTRRNPPL